MLGHTNTIVRAVAVVALILCVLVLLFGTSNFQECTNTQQQSYSAQEAEKGIPGISVALAYRDCFGRWATDNNPAITALSTLLLFFVTGGLVWVAHRQYKTTRAELRAYVFVEGAHIEQIGVGESPVASINIKNFGKTPAYKLKHWASMGFHLYPLTAAVPKQKQDEISAERPLAPGGEFYARPAMGQPLNQKTIDTMKKGGSHALFVVGEIFYEDIFHRKHWTKYCLFAGGAIGLGTGELAAYEKYNDAD